MSSAHVIKKLARVFCCWDTHVASVVLNQHLPLLSHKHGVCYHMETNFIPMVKQINCMGNILITKVILAPQLFKKFLLSCGIRTPITVPQSWNWTPSWASWIQSTLSRLVSIKSVSYLNAYT